MYEALREELHACAGEGWLKHAKSEAYFSPPQDTLHANRLLFAATRSGPQGWGSFSDLLLDYVGSKLPQRWEWTSNVTYYTFAVGQSSKLTTTTSRLQFSVANGEPGC